MIEQAKFTYFLLGITFEKQNKTFETEGKKQITAIEDHGKKKSNACVQKDSMPLSEQKVIYKLIVERMNTIYTIVLILIIYRIMVRVLLPM